MPAARRFRRLAQILDMGAQVLADTGELAGLRSDRVMTEHVKIFYNRQRKLKKLGCLSPAAYERLFYQLQKAA